ncbi:MAG: hypothetical protein ACHQJ4_00810 [Ignavibacteria bacterium]
MQLIIISVIVFNRPDCYTQVKEENPFLKWSSWIVLQALPSVTFYEDNNATSKSIRTGFGWQVVPISYTFRTNRYLSHLNFFYLQPVKRFTGSAELYFQPEYVFGGFKNAPVKRFLFKSGVRSIFPLAQRGEYLAFSLGAGVSYQRTLSNNIKYNPTLEAGVYSFFGMLGLKFNYNPNAPSKYSFGIYIKYF